MLDIVIALRTKKEKSKNKYEIKTDCMIVYTENPKESTNHVVKLCLVPSYKNNLVPSYSKRYMQRAVVFYILTTNR